MKKTIQLLGFLALCCTGLLVKADVPVFGNTTNGGSGFALALQDDNILSGGAVEFTPSENIDVSSVSLWLQGFNGQYNFGVSASICGNGPNYDPFSPVIVTFDSPLPNDGSLAPFIFSNPSGSTLLLANTPYWLVVTPYDDEINSAIFGAVWQGGGSPTGDAAYDGSEFLNYYGDTYTSSSVVPAFTINTVPEPGEFVLVALSVVVFASRGCMKAGSARQRRPAVMI
jgi:hypothetical protein